MPTPSRCIERALAIRERAVGPDHPDTATSTEQSGVVFSGSRPPADALPLVQRLIATARAAPRRAAGAVGRAATATDRDRQGARRRAQRDPARHPVVGGVRRQQARRAARRRQRPPRRTGAPRPGSRRRSRGARQGDRGGGVEGAHRSATSPPSSAARARLAAIAGERAALAKNASPAEFPDYAALSNPLPMTVKEIQSLLSDDEAHGAVRASPRRKATSLRLTREGFDWKPIPLGAEALAQQGRRLPPRPRYQPRRAMPPANPACSISRWPTSSTQRCWGRSRR